MGADCFSVHFPVLPSQHGANKESLKYVFQAGLFLQLGSVKGLGDPPVKTDHIWVSFALMTIWTDVLDWKRESCLSVVLWGRDVAVPSCGRCWGLRRFDRIPCLEGNPWLLEGRLW